MLTINNRSISFGPKITLFPQEIWSLRLLVAVRSLYSVTIWNLRWQEIPLLNQLIAFWPFQRNEVRWSALWSDRTMFWWRQWQCSFSLLPSPPLSQVPCASSKSASRLSCLDYQLWVMEFSEQNLPAQTIKEEYRGWDCQQADKGGVCRGWDHQDINPIFWWEQYPFYFPCCF